jgi:GTP-binding protein
MARPAAHDVQLAHFCSKVDDCPDAVQPEFAFSGRSNVGKSSLVNLLTGRRKLAYTSKHPGKTQCFTYYTVNGAWNLVDMPGYGYAKVGPSERRSWAQQAQRYFRNRDQLAGILQLLDMKVGPTEDDRQRLSLLQGLQRPLALVFTKCDKVSPSRREERLRGHLEALSPGLPPGAAVILSSAREKTGTSEIWAWMEDVLGGFSRD